MSQIKKTNLSLIKLHNQYKSEELTEALNMRHATILRSIERIDGNLDADTNRCSLWFSATYTDSQGKKRPCYVLTKKGLLLLASKFNDNLRLALIERLEFLEKERLRTQQILSERLWDKEDREDLIPRWG